MKKIVKILVLPVLLSVGLFSCIKETLPNSSYITDDQRKQVSGLASASVGSLGSNMKQYDVLGNGAHYDFGYVALLISRDYMGQDYTTNDNGGYFWWSRWYGVDQLEPDWAPSRMYWSWYYKQIYSCKDIISMVADPATASDDDRHAVGIAYVYKALAYLDMVQLYLQGSYASNPDGPTVPWIDGETVNFTNNPRQPASVIYTHIYEMLDVAEACLSDYTATNITMPDVSVINGLRARAYLAQEDWANAEHYAQLAQAGHTAMTETQFLDPTTGFNTPNSAWMWGVQANAQDRIVTSGIVNWISWLSSECDFSYMGVGTAMYPLIDAHLYSMIPATDWRKNAYVAPGGQATSNSNSPYKASFPDLASLKFHPNGGNYSDNLVAAAAAFPLMRVEEMILIEAEAAGHRSLGDGMAKLNAFAQTRNPSFTSVATRLSELVDEIVLQRRIELWGEGFASLDLKRLNLPIVRAYKFNGGTQTTNHPAGVRYNTNGYPKWLDVCINTREFQYNPGLGTNNPAPAIPDDITDENLWVNF